MLLGRGRAPEQSWLSCECARAREAAAGAGSSPLAHGGAHVAPRPPAADRPRSLALPARRPPSSVGSLVSLLPSPQPPARLRACDSRTGVLGAERPDCESSPEVSERVPSWRRGAPGPPARHSSGRPPARRPAAAAPHLLLSAGCPWVPASAPASRPGPRSPKRRPRPRSPRKRAPRPPAPLPPPGQAWWSPSRPPAVPGSSSLTAVPGRAGASSRARAPRRAAGPGEARVAVGELKWERKTLYNSILAFTLNMKHESPFYTG